MKVSKYLILQLNSPLHVYSGRLGADSKTSSQELRSNMSSFGAMSIFVEIAGKVGLLGFCCKVQNNSFSIESSATSVKFSIEISRVEVEVIPVVNGKCQFECRHESNFIAVFRILRTTMILVEERQS